MTTLEQRVIHPALRKNLCARNLFGLLLLIAMVPIYPAVVSAQSSIPNDFIDSASLKSNGVICGLKSDGTVDCVTSWSSTRFDIPADFPALTSLSAGEQHFCGIDTEGSARCWGTNNYGQLNVPTIDQRLVSISAGGHHTCAITDLDQVLCWGLNSNGQSNPPRDGIGFIDVASFGMSTCGLKSDGFAECWGGGGVNDPSTLVPGGPYTEVVTDLYGVCGILTTGEYVCGRDEAAKLEGTYLQVVTTSVFACGLRTDFSINCLAQPTVNFPDQIEFFNAIPVDAQYSEIRHTGNGICAITFEGAIDCWARELRILPPGIDRPVITPTGLTATVHSTELIELSWNEIFDPINNDINTGYEIFRNGDFLSFTTASSSYVDISIEPDKEYRYAIRAVRFDQERSELTPEVEVNTNSPSDTDSEPSNYTVPNRPSKPRNIQALVYSDTTVEVIWSRPAFGVATGYEIRRNGEFYMHTFGISFLDDAISPDNCYRYEIIAVDNNGNIYGTSTLVLPTGDLPGCR